MVACVFGNYLDMRTARGSFSSTVREHAIFTADHLSYTESSCTWPNWLAETIPEKELYWRCLFIPETKELRMLNNHIFSIVMRLEDSTMLWTHKREDQDLGNLMSYQ